MRGESLHGRWRLMYAADATDTAGLPYTTTVGIAAVRMAGCWPRWPGCYGGRPGADPARRGLYAAAMDPRHGITEPVSRRAPPSRH